MTVAGEALPAATSVSAGASLAARFDKLGVVIAAIIAFALFVEPFAALKPNRIVSGKGFGLFDALPPGVAAAGAALIIAGAAVALLRTGARLRLAGGAAALAGVLILIGLVPAHLVAPGDGLARVGPDAGFWLFVFAFALLVTDAVTRLGLGPLARVAALVAAFAIIAVILGSGLWSGLSVMREYAAHADSFWPEGARHVELAFGSLAAALVVGLPLGVGCQRYAPLRAVTLPVLNIIQTIPSIAMFGLMMAPLGALAARFPWLADIGVHGVGAAPALIALFLYSLLPVAANMVAGLEAIPRDIVEAARGMGLTARERLFGVELPLAAPVILAGVRIVLIQNIGLVTVAALIGGGGFGAFVFQGLGQSATDLVLLGAVPTIALAFVAAILMDALIEFLSERRA